MMQGNDPDYDFPTKEEIVNVPCKTAKDVEATTATEETKAAPLLDYEVEGGKIVKTKPIRMLNAEEWTLTNGCKVYYKFCDQNGIKVSLLGESSGGMSLLPAENLPSASALSTLAMYSGLYKHDVQMIAGSTVRVSRAAQHHACGNIRGRERACVITTKWKCYSKSFICSSRHPRFDQNDFEKFCVLEQTTSRKHAPAR